METVANNEAFIKKIFFWGRLQCKFIARGYILFFFRTFLGSFFYRNLIPAFAGILLFRSDNRYWIPLKNHWWSLYKYRHQYLFRITLLGILVLV